MVRLRPVAIVATGVLAILGLSLLGYVLLPPTIPFSTIDQGGRSSYRAGEHTGPGFAGGCLAIRDEGNWRAFWDVHTSGRSPSPPVPDVDFTRSMVLGCLLGNRRTCCDSSVEIVAVRTYGSTYRVQASRIFASGPFGSEMNPYHLVRLPVTRGPVVFIDRDTHESIPEIPPVP